MKCRTGLIKGHAVDRQVPACLLRIPFKQQRHLKFASLDLSGQTDERLASADQYIQVQRQVREEESIKIYPFPQLRTSAYSFTRHYTEPAGRFCACQAWRISGSAEEKRSPAAGSEAGGSGEPQAVWSPAQLVSTRHPSLDLRWLLPQCLARCVTRSGTQMLALKPQMAQDR